MSRWVSMFQFIYKSHPDSYAVVCGIIQISLAKVLVSSMLLIRTLFRAGFVGNINFASCGLSNRKLKFQSEGVVNSLDIPHVSNIRNQSKAQYGIVPYALDTRDEDPRRQNLKPEERNMEFQIVTDGSRNTP